MDDIVAPYLYFSKGIVEPSGGRELWLSLEQRITVMTWSDIISGALLIFLWLAILITQQAYICLAGLFCGCVD